MKIIRIIMLLGLLPLLASCSSDGLGFDSAEQAGAGQVTFRFGLQADVTAGVRTRSEQPEPIARMWYAIADERGEVIKPLYQKLEADFSKLTIEGLGYGDYTVVFLATTHPESDITVDEPALLSDAWLVNHVEKAPLDEAWFYKKIALHIGREQAPVMQTVCLEPCVGRVDVDLDVSSDYMWRFIRNIEVSFDDAQGVYAGIQAGGEYAGAGGVDAYNITQRRSFYSLPGREALSGRVTIESERSDGTSFMQVYRFSGCKIEAGRVSHIRINYRHPESGEGLLYVREEDFSRFRTDTMFLADEPREVFYDSNRRSFRVNAPLQVSVSDDHQLLVKFFSPIGISGVKILCRFNKVSTEFFELARFDRIYPFMEASFPLPVVSSERTFAAENGRRITVPAQPELSNDDVTLLVRTEDPFMKKIEQIDSRWFIRFSAYSADNGHAYWRHMDPLLCRHGVALVLNMAFMFASEEFNVEMNAYEGKLKDNGGNPIDLDALRQRIRNHGGLVLGRVVGVGGLGGGNTYGLADYCYKGVYFDATAPGANPHNYARQAMFHEYGHCLGYNHSSTMTYGDQWTVLCATVFVGMGQDGKLPVCSKEVVGGLPM